MINFGYNSGNLSFDNIYQSYYKVNIVIEIFIGRLKLLFPSVHELPEAQTGNGAMKTEMTTGWY